MALTDASAIDPFRHHGGRIDAARVAFPHAPADWIDLSTGISPFAWPGEQDPAMLTALPSPRALAGLEAAAAAAFAVADPATVVAVPGSDLALRLLGRMFGAGPDPRVAVAMPGYSGHVRCWPIPPAALSADALPWSAADHRIVLLANPNNPDGRRIERTVLLRTARLLSDAGGWLIVDEAFADVTAGDSLADSAAGGLILLRSFGKFFGLPGLRLGFVIAPRPVAHALRGWLGDWPLSGPAIAIGTAAYRDLGWQQAQRLRLIQAADRLDRLLVAARLPIHGGTALFRLTGGGDALFRQLAGHAILTRPFAEDDARLRIGIPGTEPQWQRLAAALEQWS